MTTPSDDSGGDEEDGAMTDAVGTTGAVETTDAAAPATLWIGTYAGGGGLGAYPLVETGAVWRVGTPYRAALNASFGAYSPRFDCHYLVDERDDGAIGVHRHDGAAWQKHASVPSAGAAPCHIALDHAQSRIAVANYASGSVTVYRLDPTKGMPYDPAIAPPFVHVNSGNGPNPDRQRSPHAHWVGFAPDDSMLYAADLGTDTVLAFPIDAFSGAIAAPHVAFAAPPGSGPRQMLLHPRHPRSVYLACELSNRLIVLDVASDALVARASVSTLPTDWSEARNGGSIVAHIGANAAGDRLYVSNRGHDSIAVFALDAAGLPTPLQHVPSGGASPRCFLLCDADRRMIVAHERDHWVTMLDILADGRLASTDIALHVPGAAFVFTA